MYRFTVYADIDDMAMLAEYAGVDCDLDDESDENEIATLMLIPSEAHAAQMVRVLHGGGYKWHIGARRTFISDPTFARASNNIARRAVAS